MTTLDGVDRAAAGRRHRHRRRARPDRAGGRHGRREQRDRPRRRRRCCWKTATFDPARHPPHVEAAGAAQRGFAPFRARRRRRGHPARQPARGGHAGARWAAARSRGRGSIGTRSRRRYAGWRCRARGCRGWRGSRSRARRRPRSCRRSASPASPTAAIGCGRRSPASAPTSPIEEDLVEEVMRLVGYDRAPARLPRSQRRARAQPADVRRSRPRSAGRARPVPRSCSWGFVPRGWLAPLGARHSPKASWSRTRSPPDYEVMRTSLLPALLDAARRNVVRGRRRPGAVRGRPGRLARPRRQGAARASRPDAAAILVGGAPLAQARRSRRLLRRQARRRRAAARRWASPSPRFAPRARRPPAPGGGAAIARRRTGGAGRPGRRSPPALRRALGLEERAFYLEVMLDAIAGSAAADAQRAAAAIPRGHARHLVLDRPGGDRRTSSGRCWRRPPSRCCASWRCARTTRSRDMPRG